MDGLRLSTALNGPVFPQLPLSGRARNIVKMGVGCGGGLALSLPFFDDRMGESGVNWSIETRLEGGSCWSPALIPSLPPLLLLAIGLRLQCARCSEEER